MGKLIDISGQKFGRLTCIEMCGRKNGHVQWKFICDCGNVLIARGIDVRQGKTTSCGCRSKEVTSKITKGKSPKVRKEEKIKRLKTKA